MINYKAIIFTVEKHKFTVGMSDFATKRHVKGKGHSYTSLSFEELIQLTVKNWDKRTPGRGETDLSRKVVIPISEKKDQFFCASVLLQKGMKLASEVGSRREGEDLFIKTYLKRSLWSRLFGPRIEPEKAEHISVVCYSKEALLENDGERITDCDWEIVALICSPVEKEPMFPLTMARNMLGKVGGTKSEYSAEEFAESIYYWSQRINAGG